MSFPEQEQDYFRKLSQLRNQLYANGCQRHKEWESDVLNAYCYLCGLFEREEIESQTQNKDHWILKKIYQKFLPSMLLYQVDLSKKYDEKFENVLNSSEKQ